MRKYDWQFAKTGRSSIDGINNPLVSHFTGNYNYHLAREIIQNSLDAKIKGDENPVLVEFDLVELSKEDFPGRDRLLDVIELSKKFWPVKNEKTQEFLNKAGEVLRKDVITFLRCSDHHTRGLSGSDVDLEGSWFNLVKSRGSSFKNKGEGGSFGIGKGAPFAASELRTVFYYTKNQKSFHIFQGVSELVSFQDGEIYGGRGTFGADDFGSIRNLEEIPSVFRRSAGSNSGVDIYIGGFKQSSDWKADLVQSVLRNFWYAIYKEELVVSIADIEITKETLEDLLADYFAGEKVKDDIEPIGNPLKFYETVKYGTLHETKLKNLGKVQFYFKEIEEHMNYVSMMRRAHMGVYSKPYRYPGSYCGVFICEDKEGNDILRKMEPPTHNRWEPEAYGPEGSNILNEIHVWIRKILKSKIQIRPKGVLEIPDTHKYLPFDEGDEPGKHGGGSATTGKLTDEESSRKQQDKLEEDFETVVSPTKVSVINKSNVVGRGGKLRGKGKRRKTGGGKGLGGPGKSGKIIDEERLRVVSYVTHQISNGYEYKLILKSKTNGNCSLKLLAVGDEGADKVRLINVQNASGDPIHYSNNRIHRLNLQSGVEHVIYCQIESLSKYAIKVNAYELQ